MKKLILILVTVFLLSSEISCQVFINEIMYAPNDATNEWFEMYNAGNISVNLSNWKWKDATSTIRTITSQNIFLQPQSYALICQDSVKLKNQFAVTGVILQTPWSTLNNSGDNVTIMDLSGISIDSVSYLTSWGGNNGGNSLEKLILQEIQIRESTGEHL